MEFTLDADHVNVNKFDVNTFNKIKGQWTRGKISYNNFPVSFDIETSSFYQDDNKCACMYIWMMCINGVVVYGRTWDEWLKFINKMCVEYQIGEDKRLIIYVHNLGYEFQFIRKYFNWINVFSNKERSPIYAITDTGIEFRCSYLLSGSSLDVVSRNLTKYKCRKLVGNLDYELVRTSTTPITPDELNYCFNDVIVVCCYIQELIEKYHSIAKLPNTKTGFVRSYCHSRCLKSRQYRNTIANLTIDPDEYLMLKEAFQGGYTHSNIMMTNKTIENVTSYDLTSSYPSVMIAERFPMSKGKFVTPSSYQEFDDYIKNYCCVFEIKFKNIKSMCCEDYIARYKCWEISDFKVNNGRIIEAKRLGITITDVDYKLITTLYTFDDFEIGKMIIYERGYLPTEFVKCIIDLYKDKTTLKGVDGKEYEYQLSKEMINSCYGMCVTDIVREEIEYCDGWHKSQPDLRDAIDKYNKSQNRFLFYAWGLFVTAYARRNLFSAIYNIEQDYIYSDTDSVKFINGSDHMDFFNKYNNIVTSKIHRALDHHNIAYSECNPKTIKGVEKPLGVFDFDGQYKKFKTLGAKRYMVETDNGLSFTISGVNKSYGVPYLLKKYNNDIDKIFKEFNNGLEFPPDATGKMTHTYIDEEISGSVVDYLGNVGTYHELSFIHLEKAEYSLSIESVYLNLLLDIEENFYG